MRAIITKTEVISQQNKTARVYILLDFMHVPCTFYAQKTYAARSLRTVVILLVSKDHNQLIIRLIDSERLSTHTCAYVYFANLILIGLKTALNQATTTSER